MAGNKKKESEKIQFFKLGTGSGIKPAFPNTRDEGTSHTRSVVEPLLPGTGGTERIDPSTWERPENTKLEEQLHLLKPQIEDISRIPDQGALTQDQVEVLRRYISLKETEVRDLREQKRQYQAFIKKVSVQVEELSNRNRELASESDVLRRQNEGLQGENVQLRDKHSGEMKEFQSELEEKLRRSNRVDSQMDSLSREKEEWKAKIREELKRIKLKERELENKYELLKRDAQALLDSKDKHVLELKKKNDAFELELESLEERLRRSNVILNSIDSKRKRLVETMKLAINLLEVIDKADPGSELEDDVDEEKKAG